jgi:hypothetical protein
MSYRERVQILHRDRSPLRRFGTTHPTTKEEGGGEKAWRIDKTEDGEWGWG